MSMYDPLRFHLTELKQNEWQATFKQIEEILGCTLPATARARPQLWANEEDGQHTQAKSWLKAGWRTENLNLTAETVRFYRKHG